jgi:hypothetical protein
MLDNMKPALRTAKMSARRRFTVVVYIGVGSVGVVAVGAAPGDAPGLSVVVKSA